VLDPSGEVNARSGRGRCRQPLLAHALKEGTLILMRRSNIISTPTSPRSVQPTIFAPC